MRIGRKIDGYFFLSLASQKTKQIDARRPLLTSPPPTHSHIQLNILADFKYPIQINHH